MPAVTNGWYREQAMRVTALGLLVACALSASACEVDLKSGPEQVDPVAWKWNAPAAAPATVYVRNTNGSVEVKAGTGTNVEVTAEVRWRRGDPKRDIKFQGMVSGNTITICALWKESTCSTSDNQLTKSRLSSHLFGNSDDETVAFTVYVPSGVKVDAFTVNGSIGVAATAPVRARTINGTIKVATSTGPVDAETVNGDVDVRMTTLGADGPVRARTVAGSASAYLPEKFDGSVELTAVVGSIASDFPGTTVKEGEKKFTATLGNGGRTVDIGTVTGSAALHKLKADGTVAAP
jgi:hypothetical protein